MKLLKIEIVFVVFFCLVNHVWGNEAQEAAWKKNQLNRLKTELSSSSERLMWLGSNLDLEFTLQGLTREDRYDYLQIGKRVVEEDSNPSANYFIGDLASYYFDKWDYKKALYYALKGAEKGSISCMRLLTTAYDEGKGVIRDQVESLKWIYLASAIGSPQAKDTVANLEKLNSESSKNMVRDARDRAIAWMNAHPEAFISPK